MPSVPKLDLQTSENHVKDTIVIVMVVLFIYAFSFFLEAPLHAVLSQKIDLRSEFTVAEQLSKFLLFLIVLSSVVSYRSIGNPTQIKLSIALLLSAIVLYMAESNMIKDVAQPVFGFVIVGCTGMLLLRLRFWLSFIFFTVAIILISAGALCDRIGEDDMIASLLPTFVCQLPAIASEERFEVAGIAFLCLSALQCFRVPLHDLIANNKKGILLMLLASAMITVGNGFLHGAYNPTWKVHLVALVMTIVGFLGLMFANKQMLKRESQLTLVTKEWFYVFMFFFFVLLPSIHESERLATALLVWLPTMILIAIGLWRCHPALKPDASFPHVQNSGGY